MPEMNSRHSKTPKFLLHRPIYRLNLVIFGFLRYDLCLPITDFSVITAISLLFLCYICYGFSVMNRSRLYRVSHYLLDTLHDHVSIVGLSKFHQNIYFTKKEGCPFNLNHLSSDYVSQVKSYNFLKNNF